VSQDLFVLIEQMDTLDDPAMIGGNYPNCVIFTPAAEYLVGRADSPVTGKSLVRSTSSGVCDELVI
jgi:hypothetical protein